MSRRHCRGAAVLTAMALVAGLTACSGGAKEYDSVGQLLTAYKSAGGTCAQSQDVPESMVSEGAHSKLCTPGVNFLTVFDSEEQTNRYLALILDGEKLDVIAGKRWVVAGAGVAKYADDLGGTVKVEQK